MGSPSAAHLEANPQPHAGRLQEASVLTWRLDPRSLALILGHSGQSVVSGVKEEAGSSTYPQLIPGTTGTRGETDGRIRSQLACPCREEQRLSLYVDLSQRCREKTPRSSQDWETAHFYITEIPSTLHQSPCQVPLSVLNILATP